MLNLTSVVSSSSATSTPPVWANFVPIILIFVIFYFLLIRPQQKKQKDHENMITELKKNDEVITAGGIHGTVMNVKDRVVTVKIDDNVKVDVEKSHISQVTKQ